MPLPQIKQPTYEIDLYSIKKTVEFRPYTVGEEKILLMTRASKDSNYVVRNTKNVIQSCIITPDIDVNKLAAYDIDHLLIKLRAHSENEVVEFDYENPTTKEVSNLSVDLSEIDVTFFDGHEYKVDLDGNVGVIMKDLSFEDSLKYRKNAMDAFQAGKSREEIQINVVYDALVDCIKQIYDGDNVSTTGDDVTRDEVYDFIMNLPSPYRRKITKFFDTMPVVKVVTQDKNGKEIVINNINDFLV